MQIIIDTSTIIEMYDNTHRHIVFKHTVWNKIAKAIKQNEVILLQSVYDELSTEIRNILTVSPIDLSHYQDEYEQIIQKYEDEQTKSIHGADPHILAYALKLKNEGKNPLIVTAEGIQPKLNYKIRNKKIPTMAQELQIQCYNKSNWGRLFEHILQPTIQEHLN